MNKLFIGVFFLLYLSTPYTQAQEDKKKEVQKTIEKLFEGMNEVDTNKVRSTFHESARLQTVFFHPKEQKTAIHTSLTIDNFFKQIATGQKGAFKEHILEYTIQVDENMATAWTPYKFYLNGVFSHCGVNAFQLVNINDTWQIVQIIDTRRKQNCD